MNRAAPLTRPRFARPRTKVNKSCPHIFFPLVNVTHRFRVHAAALLMRRGRPASSRKPPPRPIPSRQRLVLQNRRSSAAHARRRASRSHRGSATHRLATVRSFAAPVRPLDREARTQHRGGRPHRSRTQAPDRHKPPKLAKIWAASGIRMGGFDCGGIEVQTSEVEENRLAVSHSAAEPAGPLLDALDV